ncbi:MAG TPA: hypothetical protein DF427_02360 [Moraxellaceae bacterium]|nr:hypothetical protein [Moraxellaceae bacterium]
MSVSVLQILSVLLVLACLAAVFFAMAWYRVRDQHNSLNGHLQASESQYRQLLGVADLAIAVLDEACHVVDWNPVLERLYGLSRHEMLGRQFFMCCAPGGDAAALSARMMAMRGSDAVLEFSFPVQANPDNERQLRWRARHFTDARDGRRYLSLVGHDVTDVESMQQWLADSEARFRLMFEAVPASLALLDAEGRLLMVNPACARFFGYDAPEQMVMLNVQELVHEDDRQASMMALAALHQQPDTLYQMEKRYLVRDGQVRWGNMRCRLLSLAPGQSLLLAQISDVHERKQTEMALFESERRMATLIANLSGAVYRYELPALRQGLHHDRPAAFLSDGTSILTGQMMSPFARGQQPHSLGALILPEDRPVLQAALESAFAGSGRFDVTYRLRHGPSGIRWVSESGCVQQRPDCSWTVDGHITDITAERHARETELVFRTLVTQSHTGFVSLNLDGRVLDANQPFCAMAGVESPEQLLGRPLELFMPPGREGQLQRFLARVIRDGVLRDVEFTLPGLDGRQVRLLVNALTVEQAGQSAIKCLLVDLSRQPGAPSGDAEDRLESVISMLEEQDGIA